MFLKIIRNIFALSLAAILLVVIWLTYELATPRSFPTDKVFFEVDKGMGLASVARALEAQGLIRDEFPFLVYFYLFFSPQKIKAGEYVFEPPLRAREVLEALVKGKIYLHAVTVPEGLTALEMFPLFQPLLSDGEEAYRAAFQDTKSIFSLDGKAKDLEGYLYPETYHLPKGISSEEALQAMVAQFQSVFDELWLSRTRQMRMTVRRIVILASLIEKETSIHEEKRLVSAVFHNRLRLGMKLDCDPTIIYALKRKGAFDGRLGRRDMALNSPYNTYLHPGLPPGPICNPGRESLEAALFPAAADYLYFVSRNDGSHHFSRSFAEHQSAVRRYQKGR